MKRPRRVAVSREVIIKAEIAKEMVDSTGFNEISLCSLSTSDYTGLEELEKELGEYKQRCAEYEEFKVRFSQLEDENKALRANTESSADNAKEIEAIRAELSEVKQMCDLQAKEIKTLKRTNASLEKQVNELMEDGQLTL